MLNKIIELGFSSTEAKELIKVSKNIESDPKITLTYFIKDKNKQGGKIVTEIISIKKIDLITEELISTDKRKISLKNIIDIE